MLSIIISSYQPNYYSAIQKNIAETCGVPYEIIKIDNPGLMGICEAYNKGAQKAKYDNLLFVHEDVKFHTPNWGFLLMKHYNLDNLGVFGLAGCKKKFDLPYGFYSGLPKNDFIFLNHKGDRKIKFEAYANPFKIQVIDGVFIGMSKKIWNEFLFNELITGFHFYDIDISLRVSSKYQNYLITDIDFEHYSKGNYGDEWINASINFHKSKNYTFSAVTSKEKRDIRNFWYGRLFNEKINLYNRIKFAYFMGCNKDTWHLCYQFIVKKSKNDFYSTMHP